MIEPPKSLDPKIACAPPGAREFTWGGYAYKLKRPNLEGTVEIIDYEPGRKLWWTGSSSPLRNTTNGAASRYPTAKKITVS